MIKSLSVAYFYSLPKVQKKSGGKIIFFVDLEEVAEVEVDDVVAVVEEGIDEGSIEEEVE